MRAFALLMVAYPAIAGTMPVPQQNELIAKYCSVCHSDAHPNGGISLEHFDAGHPDAGIVAMMVSKFRGNAFGASGQALPDKATQQDLVRSLTEEAAGAAKWIVSQAEKTGTVSVGIVRKVERKGAEPDFYRLTVTCRPDTTKGEIQVSWSPDVPQDGAAMTTSTDGGATVRYAVTGKETMGNGQAGTSGPGAWVLDSTALPRESLRIGSPIRDESVDFPFSELTERERRALGACFTR